MSTEESWLLTHREFQARRKVRDEYLAMWKVEIRNAPRIVNRAKRLWVEADFLNPQEAGNAVVLAQKKATKDKFEELQFEMLVNKTDVPDWAKADYQRYEAKR